MKLKDQHKFDTNYSNWIIQMENGDVFPDINTIVVFENKLWTVKEIELQDDGLILLKTTEATNVFDKMGQMMKQMKDIF